MIAGYYCPFCQRVVVASNIDEVESGEHDGHVFVHDAQTDHADDFQGNYLVMH